MNQKSIAPCGMNCGLCQMYLQEKDKCPGCSSGRKVHNRCIKCGIKLCKNRHGDFCHECDQFPCERLERLDRRYREKYGMSEIENLKAIKKDGLKKFIESEKKKWENETGTFCVHDKKRYPKE